MLILVGTVPTAYALNHAMGTGQTQNFAVVSTQMANAMDKYVVPDTVMAEEQPELEQVASPWERES